MGVHMALCCLLLQNLSKLIFADAAEEGGHFRGLLDHPLKQKTPHTKQNTTQMSW